MQIDKKDHIMNIAIELFAEKGFEGCSIRDLATRADVNVAMINYYFGSKDKLFEAMVEKKASYMRGVLDELVADHSLTELEKIDLVIERYVHRFLSHPLFHKVMQQELLVSHRVNLHLNVINLFVKNTQAVVTIIEKGIRKKLFRKVDPQMTFATIIGTINQVLMSKTMCNKLMNQDDDYEPFSDPHFEKRLTNHIKQLIHAHLLINQDL
jgi:AcrR family transcriptional regulator